jgi:hypothetical protein
VSPKGQHDRSRRVEKLLGIQIDFILGDEYMDSIRLTEARLNGQRARTVTRTLRPLLETFIRARCIRHELKRRKMHFCSSLSTVTWHHVFTYWADSVCTESLVLWPEKDNPKYLVSRMCSQGATPSFLFWHDFAASQCGGNLFIASCGLI